MILPAPERPSASPPVALPVFDHHCELIVGWYEHLRHGAVNTIIPAVTTACRQLRRVRKSRRHAQLAEFLEHALVAMHNRELEGARCILLTALATFGWPSHLAGESFILVT